MKGGRTAPRKTNRNRLGNFWICTSMKGGRTAPRKLNDCAGEAEYSKLQ